MLNDLDALGVCVFMDDGGTAYLLLSYRRQFPIDKIEID